MLTYGIPPEFRDDGVHLFIPNRHTPSGQSRVYRVTQLRTDGVQRNACVAPRHVDAWRDFYFYFLRTSSAGGGRERCQTFSFFFFFSCGADHERDWPPCKVVFFGLATKFECAECEKRQQQQLPRVRRHRAGSVNLKAGSDNYHTPLVPTPTISDIDCKYNYSRAMQIIKLIALHYYYLLLLQFTGIL